jgi:hypothetical protein
MRERVRVLLAVPAAILVATLGATSSLATTTTATTTSTWTVKPGGSSTGSNTYFYLKDPKTKAGFACQKSSLAITFKSGSGLAGAGLGSVTSVSVAKCLPPAGYGVTFSNLPYALSVSSYSSGTTTGRISGVHAVGTGPGCYFVLDGTSPKADNGYINVTYSNSSGELKLDSGGNLHFYDVSGCFGLLGSGDRATPQSIDPYKLSPKQAITNS